jgi:hypothetical protein
MIMPPTPGGLQVNLTINGAKVEIPKRIRL